MKATNQAMHPLYDKLPDDAIDMLITDHKRVARLFAEFKRLTDEGNDRDKDAIVQKICQELTVHTRLEEEIFYPAVRAATEDDDQMDEALVEHAGAKELIAQLQAAHPGDELYDARVTVLGEQIDHHVEEEEGSMFPKARHSGVDTARLGQAMLALKSQLSGENPPAPRPVTATRTKVAKKPVPPRKAAASKSKSSKKDAPSRHRRK